MELDKKIVGKRIKSERTRIGLTQEELATKLGLNNKSSISQYENGDAIPSDDVKFQMCSLFSCSLDYLLGKSDIRNPEELKKVPFANSGGLDVDGLDDDDLLELQRQIDYIKKMKNQGVK